MKKIDDLGIAERTYLVYMSDNGAGGGSRARPLQGGKGSLWEGGIRVPMIVRGPGVTPGSFCHVPVVGFDLFPTFCELAGLAEPLPPAVEGGSLVALLHNQGHGLVKRPREELVFHFPHYQSGDGPHSAIRLADYKLIKFYESDQRQLFDLSRDIGEQHNLSKEMPEKAADLSRRLEDYLDASVLRCRRRIPTTIQALPRRTSVVAVQEARERAVAGEQEKPVAVGIEVGLAACSLIRSCAHWIATVTVCSRQWKAKTPYPF